MKTKALNWPNFISLGRLLTVPILVWLILTHKMSTAFWLFIVAGLSDILDGLLARILKERTEIGAYLDPIADKALLIGVFVSLAAQKFLPLWLVILVVFRDILIISGTLLLITLNKRFTINPLLVSKVHTFAQIILVSVTLGTSAIRFIHASIVVNTMTYVVATTGLLSGVGYVYKWIIMLNKD